MKTISLETIIHVLSKMLNQAIIHAEYETKDLQGGTVGNVLLLTGMAETHYGEKLSFQLVHKTTKKWSRYADPDSWRREYDLYQSDLDKLFLPTMRWPACYHAEITDDAHILWLEYMDGVSGLDLTADMYARAAEELGRLQGKLYAQQPPELLAIQNIGVADAMEHFYYHYKSWDVVHNAVRSDTGEIPRHLCQMIIDADESAEAVFREIKKLPLVFCHRDFWVTNILYRDGEIGLIDWDTAGWGYLGEDIASLIADEADIENMVVYYHACTAAYRRGFSESADISMISNLYVRERIILHYGYRLVEWFLNADTPELKKRHIDTLQKIFEMEGGI